MINHKRIHLNLASHALKNKKLFSLLCFLLCMLFVALSVLGGFVYFSHKGKARSIKAAEVIAYEDLGPEALRRLQVEDYAAVVINDIYGGDAYEDGRKRYQAQ